MLGIKKDILSHWKAKDYAGEGGRYSSVDPEKKSRIKRAEANMNMAARKEE